MYHFDGNTEALESASLGAMGSLLKKLDALTRNGFKLSKVLRDDLSSISTRLAKLLEIDDPSLTVKYWMNDVRELSYDIEDYVDQFMLDVNYFADMYLPYTSTSTTFLAQLERISGLLGYRSRVEEMRERYDRYKLEYGLSHPTTMVKHCFPTVYGRIKCPVSPIGMDSPGNELRRQMGLENGDEDSPQLKVLSILGVEGVGKSTLAQKLWCELRGHFECKAFVQAARMPDMRTILKSILSQIRLPQMTPEAGQVSNLIRHIREHLQDKRYFIIIEDIWAVSVWDVLSRSFPEGNRCSRIITTTAIDDVALACCSYDPEYVFKMKPLCADHSYQLFISRVFSSGKGCPQQLYDASDYITRKCRGLPLATICIATLLARQPEALEHWKYVQSFLHHNLKANSCYVDILKEVLKLYYRSLHHCLKTCLLYLSIYPENYSFLKDDLVKQWIAEGFICPTEQKDIVEVASSYFDELLCSGLIQRMDIDSNKKGLSYIVHPMVFGFITCKSIEDNFITVIDYSQSTVELTGKIHRLSLHFGSATYATLPAGIGLSQVRSLMFIGLLNCMPSLAEFGLVRIVILHLQSDDRKSKFSLADICKLPLLRYLQVRCNVTVQLPNQIHDLKHLETLEINARVEAIPFDIIHVSKLSNLCIGGKKHHKHVILGPVASGKAVILRIMGIETTSRLEIFELLPPICIFSKLPKWIQILRQLYILEIVVSELWAKDISVLSKLPALEALSLHVRTPTAGHIIFSTGMFPALEYFKFVRGVLLLDFQEEALPNLRRLKIGFNAHKGERYDGMLSGIHHLLNLQKIVASIGATSGAEECDRSAAESAFKDAIIMHPCHRSFKVKRVDQVDEEYDPSVCWSQKSSTQRDEVSKEQSVTQKEGLSTGQLPIFPAPYTEKYADTSVERPAWKLAFRSQPQLPIFTGTNIVDERGNPLEVILIDVNTGSHLALSLELRIELVPLFGDYPPDGWSTDLFQRCILKQREGKHPLLTGDIDLTMRDGCVTVNELQFTDNSSLGKYRIGVRVVPGSYNGARILEAMTEAFVVRDRLARPSMAKLDTQAWRRKFLEAKERLRKELDNQASKKNIPLMHSAEHVMLQASEELDSQSQAANLGQQGPNQTDHSV